MSLVPVPHAIKHELNYQDHVWPAQLTELLAKMVGAPHLNSENSIVQDVLLGLTNDIVDLARRISPLPDIDRARAAAERAVAVIEDWELMDAITAFGLRDKEIKGCKVKDADRQFRGVIVVEVQRLLIRATLPPKPKRRGDRAA